MLLNKLLVRSSMLGVLVFASSNLAASPGHQNWSLGLGTQQLRIEQGQGSLIDLPASKLWAANIWAQRSWTFELNDSLHLRTVARLGTSRFYQRILWFIYGSFAAGPEIAFSKSTRAGLLIGYRYDQELRHGGLGSLWFEHSFGPRWGMQIAGSFTRFNVPKDAGVQVSTREFEIGLLRNLD